MTARRDEIRQLLRMSVEQIKQRAGHRLVVLPDIQRLHQHFAESIADEIQGNNKQGRHSRLILPVGPIGQYPMLADLVNSQRIKLENCWFFMMDEQCQEDGTTLPHDHPLGFRRVFDDVFSNQVDPELMVPPQQLVFPDHNNVATLQQAIADSGGIDTTYGGIGIHGHIAYNEPEANVKDTGPRRVRLNDFTITINAIRSEIGGNVENYPRHGITLGMRQLLSANRIRLYCRNGIQLDWANTVLRLALFGQPGDDYPVTHIRDHSDYVVITDEDTLRSPKYVV